MRIELAKERRIKGKLHKEGETIIVKKDYGERLISEGLANRIIGEQENRVAPEVRGRRFSGHKIFRGDP